MNNDDFNVFFKGIIIFGVLTILLLWSCFLICLMM